MRVSTEDQAKEGFSLDAQQKRLEAYCKVRGWNAAGVYREEGFSGRSASRPEYERMMSESDGWDLLLVLKMDRIHRNSVNFTLMMDDLRRRGKEFMSLQEKFDTTTAMGRFVMDVIQRIAQLESEQIGERVKIGMARKARSGDGPMGSGHPYGYVYRRGEMGVVDYEADAVRLIYSMRAEGRSYRGIAETLNETGVRPKISSRWSGQSVKNILENPLYAGYVRWDGIVRKGRHEAIVEREEYERVNGAALPDA